MKKSAFVLIFITVTILGLSIIQVTIANQIATTGGELTTLQKQITAYKKENQILEEQYLQASAFINLESKAKAIGFVEAKSQEYISTPLPLALR